MRQARLRKVLKLTDANYFNFQSVTILGQLFQKMEKAFIDFVLQCHNQFYKYILVSVEFKQR
jgi:hypothetical protein